MASTPPRPSANALLLIPALAGGAVALGLGAYSRTVEPTGQSYFSLFFKNTLQMKAWLATGAIALALLQLVSAAWMYGRLGRSRPLPGWVGRAHRITGIVAFLLTVPVAYHCLFALGFSDFDTRTLLHSIGGCLFIGAFVAKVLVVEIKRLPGFALPIAGGLLFAVLALTWWTSALWYFTTTHATY